jgi:hypothetical protein
MKARYTCPKCKKSLKPTEKNFFASTLKRLEEKVNSSFVPKCKLCTRNYHKEYTESIKARGLTRNQQKMQIDAGAVLGVVYVIGPDSPGTPYKIGVTSGTCTMKRKSALQTSHWLELKEVWKSDLLERADIVERKLHQHFAKKQVKGEWFDITRQDIDDISKLVKEFGVER